MELIAEQYKGIRPARRYRLPGPQRQKDMFACCSVKNRHGRDRERPYTGQPVSVFYIGHPDSSYFNSRQDWG